MKEGGSSGKTAAHCISIAEVIDGYDLDSSLYTTQSKVNYKKKLKLKAITRTNLKETKNCNKNIKASKSR